LRWVEVRFVSLRYVRLGSLFIERKAMSLQELHYKLEGVAPGLMMHNPRTASATDEYAIAIKQLTDKPGKKKTDADQLEIHRLSWYASLYVNDEGKLYVPSTAIVGMCRTIATNVKRGLRQLIRAGLFCFEPPVLNYEGPKNIDKLWNGGKGKYVDYRFELVQGNRIVRCRPVLPVWSLDVTLTYEDAALGPQIIERTLKTAGYLAGLLERRPEYGRFEIVEKE